MRATGLEAAARRPSKLGFTLIEILAVLLIMGLVAGLTLPNLSLGSDRAVLGEAQDLAASIAFTRQHAVATATPHRVVIDLDRASYWIETQPEPTPVAANAPTAGPKSGNPKGGPRQIRLAAPFTTGTEFHPLPGPFGRTRVLRDPVHFEAVETLAAGAVREGAIEIVFEADGTADPAAIALANEVGDVYVLHLARLADEVKIARE